MVSLSTGLRDALISQYGFGTIMNFGVIRVFGGTRPTSSDAAAGSTPLAEITTEGRVFVPETDPNGAGISLQVVSPGAITHEGVLRIKGSETGLATWWRWSWLGADDLDYSLYVPRVDGDAGIELFLRSYNITPATDEEVGRFVFSLPERGVICG